MATGLPGGIGIPHARSEAITEPSLVFGRVADGIDWGARTAPANLVFLIAAPASGGEAHMQMLPKLARALMKKEFKAALLAATNRRRSSTSSAVRSPSTRSGNVPAATSAASPPRPPAPPRPSAAARRRQPASDAGAVAPSGFSSSSA